MKNERLCDACSEVEAALACHAHFYDHAPVGFVSLTRHGAITQINLAGARLLGLEGVALTGEHRFGGFVDQADLPAFNAFWQKIFVSGTRHTLELALAGTQLPLRTIQIEAARSPNGQACSVMVVDVSHFQRIEQTARASEMFVRSTLDAASAHICVLDKAGKILAVNQAWRDFYNENIPQQQPPNDGVGSNYLEICSSATGPCADEALPMAAGIRAVIEGACDEFTMEYPCHAPTDQRWFNARVTRFHGDSGNVVVAHENITQRKLLESDLRISAIAFESQQAMFILDEARHFIRVNRALGALLGFESSEVLGRSLRSLLDLDSIGQSECDAFWSRVDKTGKSSDEFKMHRKLGEPPTILLTLTSVKNEHLVATHYVGTLIDFTDRKREQAQKEAAEIALRGALVREVHHRINNNLQGIIGILREFGRKHPQTQEPITRAVGQVQSIAVIHGLQGKKSMEQVRLCELTAAVAAGIDSLWRTSIKVHIPDPWQACLIAEHEAVPVALVLNELILNAVKHGDLTLGPLRVELQKIGDPCVARVTIINGGVWQPHKVHSQAGLQLVDALMPRHGAQLARTQQGGCVHTTLELTFPVISVENVQSP